MFSLSQLRKLLAALVLAFSAGLMLPACSSTEEETAPTDEGIDCKRGDQGRCCDADTIQEGCPEQL